MACKDPGIGPERCPSSYICIIAKKTGLNEKRTENFA